MKSISANLNVMIKASEKASKIIIRDFGEIEKLQVSKKGPRDFVTNSDLKAEKIIIEELKKARPNFSLISEESGKENNKDIKNTWIIDPIDGTKSFVIGNPTWSNLISVNYKGNPIFGLANFPALERYYFNKNDNLAYVVEKGKRRKINVNNKSKFSEMKLAGEFHGWLPLNKQQKILKVLQLMQFPSSDALSYVNFCEGRIDSVIQCVNKIWDIHAIIPIIKASGGIASTWNNKDPKNAGTILVSSNEIIHNKMLGYLKPLSKFVPGRVN